MKTKTIQIYSFSELPKEVQKKVLDDFRYINVEYTGWHDTELEHFTNELDNIGYKDATIEYSGFYSQGDGASFSADVKLSEWLKGREIAEKYKTLAKFDDLYYQNGGGFTISISSGRYYHSNMMDIETPIAYDLNEARVNEDDILTPAEYEEAEKLVEELAEIILEDAKSEADIIYRSLQKTYEYLTSDESIIETIEANGYEFNKQGGLE